MESNSRVWWWIGGIIAVIVIALGIWQLVPKAATSGTTATTTEDVATSTTASTAPVSRETRTGSVNSVLASVPDASIASGIFAQSGVEALTAGKGPYTLFVPTNEAFSYLPSGTIARMTAAQVKRLVEYHVVSGRALDIDAVSSGTVQSLSKDPLNFQVNLKNGTASVGSGYVLKEYKASNGIVYLISGVLIPPQKTQ